MHYVDFISHKVKKKKYTSPAAARIGIATESLIAASARIGVKGAPNYEDYEDVVEEISGDLIL
jgi:hypothetical protein